MKRFNNTRLLAIEGALSHLGGYIQASDNVASALPGREYYDASAFLLEDHFGAMDELSLPMTKLSVERFVGELRNPSCALAVKDIELKRGEIGSRFLDELEANGKFFYIPMPRAKMFEDKEPFGNRISKKFPRLVEDISEAAKCYSCARYTACVFHLMRIMESSLQRLGKKLKISLNVNTNNWQNILDQVNAAIKALPPKEKITKKLAAIAANLYNVKLAWRNEVMHPKSTYTEEEAEALFMQVGLYLTSLAEVIK